MQAKIIITLLNPPGHTSDVCDPGSWGHHGRRPPFEPPGSSPDWQTGHAFIEVNEADEAKLLKIPQVLLTNVDSLLRAKKSSRKLITLSYPSGAEDKIRPQT